MLKYIIKYYYPNGVIFNDDVWDIVEIDDCISYAVNSAIRRGAELITILDADNENVLYIMEV